MSYYESGAPLRTCSRCGANYHDDDQGRKAHVAVFGHAPRKEDEMRAAQ